MDKSDSQKDIDFMDGTSARTRPLSYDDIMHRRKNKGDKVHQVSSIELVQDNIERASDHMRIGDNSKHLDEKKSSSDSKRKASDTNDDRSLYPDAKSKETGDRNRVSEEKCVGRNYGSRKKDDLLSISSNSALEKSKDTESHKQDGVSERSRVKSEIVKTQSYNDERHVYRKRKADDKDNEYMKRNTRDVRQADNLTVRGREKSIKEKKYKHQPEEEKSRGRINAKRNGLERKGSEPTRTYPEESRSKKRRPRSKEREKDRRRRSRSQSPKASKHKSKDKREFAELSSYSSKGKPGREHSNADNKRIPSDGSNSQYRRNTNNSSGLGGYSPRKRKTEAAAKTPSPTHRSPERRNAGWDLQAVENESVMTASTLLNLNATSQKLSPNLTEYPSVAPVAPAVAKPSKIPLHTLSPQMHSVESIQLTQATRPKRRLYVENLPLSASEKVLLECINQHLLLSGVNYAQGTQPCISCIIHKEKSQALLEFLTPEDASAALSLDGVSFSGSSLKLRRPKDYANSVTTGLPDKSVGGVDSVSHIVEDSPNKIFVGGIAKHLSSSMLLEIVRAFGPVKAFRFEFIADTSEPCAFLEYVDHAFTSKACAGLNGMRLGGQVLTAVLATPEPVLENVGKLPTYEIPEHAKPLIKMPTTILKLKNLFDPEDLISLSESDLEEILEDIRLECSRFGMVRSVNVAKKINGFGTMEANEVRNTDAHDFRFANMSHRVEQVCEGTYGLREFEKSEHLEIPKELENNIRTLEDKNGCDNIAGLSDDVLSGSVGPEDITRSRAVDESLSNEIIAGSTMKAEVCELPFNGDNVSLEGPPSQLTGEFVTQPNSTDTERVINCHSLVSTRVMNYELEEKPSTEDVKSEEHNAKLVSSKEELKTEERNNAVNVELDNNGMKQLDAPGEGDRKEVLVDIGLDFEPGSVIVEYRRPEAACMAAHSLHGRTFNGRVVTVEYIK